MLPKRRKIGKRNVSTNLKFKSQFFLNYTQFIMQSTLVFQNAKNQGLRFIFLFIGLSFTLYLQGQNPSFCSTSGGWAGSIGRIPQNLMGDPPCIIRRKVDSHYR